MWSMPGGRGPALQSHVTTVVFAVSSAMGASVRWIVVNCPILYACVGSEDATRRWVLQAWTPRRRPGIATSPQVRTKSLAPSLYPRSVRVTEVIGYGDMR